MATVPNDPEENDGDHGHDIRIFSPAQGTPTEQTENHLRTSAARSSPGMGKAPGAIPHGPELAPGGEEPMPLESFSARYEKKISSNASSRPGSSKHRFKKSSIEAGKASHAFSPRPELAPVGEEPIPPEALSSQYEKKLASDIGSKIAPPEHRSQKSAQGSPGMPKASDVTPPRPELAPEGEEPLPPEALSLKYEKKLASDIGSKSASPEHRIQRSQRSAQGRAGIAKASNVISPRPELAPEGEEPIPLESFSSQYDKIVSGQNQRKVEKVSNEASNQGLDASVVEEPIPLEFTPADHKSRKLDANRTGSPVMTAERASVSGHVGRRAQVETLDVDVIGGEAHIEEYSTPGLSVVNQQHVNTDFRQEEKVDEDETCDVGVAIDEADGIVGGVTNEDGSPIAAFKVEDQDEVDRRVRERVLAKSISVEGHVLADIGKDGEDEPSRWWKKKWLVAVALVVVGSIIALILVPTLGSSSPQNGDSYAAPPSDGVTPTACPSFQPSLAPTVYPTALPSDSPMPSIAPSMEPSNAPTSNRFALLKGVISSISSEESLADTTSPQYKALTWLADDDDASLDADDDSARIITRYTLAVLYFSTGGPEWTNRYGFLGEQHECLWRADDDCQVLFAGWYNSFGPQYDCDWYAQGSNCAEHADCCPNPENELTAEDACCACGGVYCTQSGSGPTVTKIILANNNLTGTLPAEIGSLTGLVRLSLQRNQIQGALPSEITLLKNLEALSILHNQLTGPLPSLIGHMSSLKQIYLSHNHMVGGIPVSIGDLSELTYLSIEYNDLNGTIPDTIGDLSNLFALNLMDNKLIGSLPASIGNLTNLYGVLLSANLLTGEIPSSIDHLPWLQHLWLNHNAFTGSVPSFGSDVFSPQSLMLLGNILSGVIPPSIGALSNMEQLDLGYNMLSGTLPTEILQLPKLKEIGLFNNSLNGTIPNAIGDMPLLERFSVGYNNMTGTLPTSVGKLEHLTSLVLRYNKFTGTLPIELGQLSKLGALNIGENSFTGTIPSTIGWLSHLETLYLDTNSLHGAVPSSFRSFAEKNPALDYLHLHLNDLTGDINFLCDETGQSPIRILYADCEGVDPEVLCDCCNGCCDRDDNCNPAK